MARYMRSDLGRGHSRLSPPVVVTQPAAAIIWYGPRQLLTPKNDVRRRESRRTSYVLHPPRVVTPAATALFFGPKVTLNVHLPELQRFRVTKWGPDYELKPPIVIGPGIAFYGPGLKLAPISAGEWRRQNVHYKLRAPLVTASAGIFFGPKVTLNVQLPEQRRLRVTKRGPEYEIKPPVVVEPPIAWHGPGVKLAPVSHVERLRQDVQHDLRAPVVVGAAEVAEVYYGPRIQKAPSRRPTTKSNLAPPVVVGAGIYFVGPRIWLQLSKPHRYRPVRSVLAPPAHIQVEPSRPLPINLAYSRRGEAKSDLRKPAHVQVEPHRPIDFVLAAIENRKQRIHRAPNSLLSPPEVVGAGVYFRGPFVYLVRGRRLVAKSRLVLPVAIEAVAQLVARPTAVSLAPHARRGGKASLAPPAHVQVEPNRPPVVHLTYSRRGVPQYFLRPPADTIGIEDQGEVAITLAPRPKPRTLSQLFPPAVIGAGIVYRPVLVRFTYSRRGRPKSILRKGLVGRDVFFGPSVTLAPSRRARRKWFLRGPVVVLRPPARPIQVQLAPSFRARRKSFLRRPVVVRLAVEIFGPEITLAPSRRARRKSRLLPPAVVGRAPFRPIVIHLAPQPKPQTLYKLFAPAVIGQPPFAPIRVFRTRITPPPTLYRLFPPAVVGAGIAFYGPEVHLVRIKPPKVIVFKVVLEAPPFAPPAGDVCGFDISSSFICYVEESGTRVSGGDQSNANIESTTATDANVSGGDRADGNVIGGDQEAN